MGALAATSPLWPLWAFLAAVGFYFTLSPLLHWWPWSGARARKGSGVSDDSKHIEQQINIAGDQRGVIAHTINLAPQKGVTGEVLRENDRENGEYVTEVRLNLEAAYAASKFSVEASAESPFEFDVRGGATPQDASAMFNVFQYDHAPNHKGLSVGAPLQPAYRAIIRSHEPQTAVQVGTALE
jgi:hypothetical protein